MGRKLMRVPLDFAWPLKTTWKGYLNPHYRKCPDCENGSTADAEWLEAIIHLLMIAGPDGTKGTLHPWLADLPLRPKHPPTPRMAELTARLAGREPSPFIGHDACDKWAAQKAVLKAANLSEDWGTCPTCKGDAIDPSAAEAYEAWKEEEPPAGPGFQLWETTSEGSPVSPVFDSLDALCSWAETHATTFGSSKTTAAEWKRMLEADFVCHQEGNAVFI
jgi:hypothetical protein